MGGIVLEAYTGHVMHTIIWFYFIFLDENLFRRNLLLLVEQPTTSNLYDFTLQKILSKQNSSCRLHCLQQHTP